MVACFSKAGRGKISKEVNRPMSNMISTSAIVLFCFVFSQVLSEQNQMFGACKSVGLEISVNALDGFFYSCTLSSRVVELPYSAFSHSFFTELFYPG